MPEEGYPTVIAKINLPTILHHCVLVAHVTEIRFLAGKNGVWLLEHSFSKLLNA